MSWSAIAVTCKTKEDADALKKELILRQKRNLLPKDVILLCVEDPQEGLGSGGATLNALLVVAEHLSARNNLTVVSTDILENARILILHLGRYFSHDPCGRAFVPLPISKKGHELEDFYTNFDALYHTVTNQLNPYSPPGLWVCSTDMILSLPPNAVIDSTMLNSDICCISVPSTVEYAMNHGVYKIDEKGSVNDIIYKGTEDEIKSCIMSSAGDQETNNIVSLVSGIVFFSTLVTEKLLSLHNCAPLDACTYMGVDSGVEPIQISLYFDILLSMANGVNKEDFVSGKRGSSFGHDNSLKRDRNMELVRATLWDRLRGTKIKAAFVQNGIHKYLDVTSSPYEYTRMLRSRHNFLIPGYEMSDRSHSFVEESCNVGKDCMLVNSLLTDNVTVEEGCFIAHSCLKRNIKIGKKCVIMGLDEEACELITDIPDCSFIMGANVNLAGFGRKKIFCCLWDCDTNSISDDIHKILGESKAPSNTRVVHRRDMIETTLREAGPLPASYLNLLPAGRDSERLQHNTLLMAKLFPILHTRKSVDIRDSLILLKNTVSAGEYKKWDSSWKFSIFDILEQTDRNTEFEYRRDLSVKISCQKIENDLISNKTTNLHPLYIMGVLTKRHDLLLSALDKAALTCVEQGKKHLCARVFSCIAEVLALVAGENAGLRSGPAANREWKKALIYLERNEFKDGITALSTIRKDWLGHPDLLIRAARHYERAEQISIRHACVSVSHFISTLPGSILNEGTWLVCECPARIDLAGGWSDTPPICYENGGSVVNVALMMENQRPIGARVRLTDTPTIVMTMLGKDKLSSNKVVCETIDSFKDYCQPQAMGALLKACFVLSEIVSLDSKLSLKEQLLQRYGKGFEIQTWSSLPRGSGLGTSSILAGVVISVLLRSVGRIPDTNSVIHAVVMLEQMLTTGGGWQDQVGGMVGGIKCCSSNAELPLNVTTEPIIVPDHLLKSLQERMKLIYTGKTRLARNMLQDVLRNWYARKPQIIANCRNLVSNALKCKKAFEEGDLATVGECLNEYWRQKKIMAPGCEPASCAEIMRILHPYILGQTLAGAGGGGFLCIILKEPKTKEFLKNLLKDVKTAEDLVVHDVTVDVTGMQVYETPVE